MFSKDFLDTAEDVNSGVTAVNGTDFTSNVLTIPGGAKNAAFFVTFTRSAGDGSNVDFQFQVSSDYGTTWTTAYYYRIQVPSNEDAASNVVVAAEEVSFNGEFTNVRLYKIVNNDAVNNITACNATMHIGAK